ncbi:hypothetical protein PMIN02_010331 [Paraphaeosphaeria minitans]|uniref:Uncharacterized protein n=1 Tax=Paraphaeosphaeria minitans TaxID=565426 RepID=A0A9P6KMD8_9PLEO|nr:hypothetical protein PMIN01_09771 [Paraphaeosphaeria minitans]
MRRPESGNPRSDCSLPSHSLLQLPILPAPAARHSAPALSTAWLHAGPWAAAERYPPSAMDDADEDSTVSKRESPCAPHLPSINAIPSATSRNGGATRQLAKSRLGDYSVSIHLRAGARAGRHFSLAGPDFFLASQGYRESQGLRGLGVYFRTFYSGVGVGVG